jgi:hypothetical protein
MSSNSRNSEKSSSTGTDTWSTQRLSSASSSRRSALKKTSRQSSRHWRQVARNSSKRNKRRNACRRKSRRSTPSFSRGQEDGRYPSVQVCLGGEAEGDPIGVRGTPGGAGEGEAADRGRQGAGQQFQVTAIETERHYDSLDC